MAKEASMCRSVRGPIMCFPGKYRSASTFRNANVRFWRFSRCISAAEQMRQRADGVWYFEVNNLVDLIQKVIPFLPTVWILVDQEAARFRQVRRTSESFAKWTSSHA